MTGKTAMMGLRCRATAVAMAFLLVAGCRVAPSSVYAETADATLAYQRLVTDLSDEQMEGRGPGTAGIDRARDYLVKQFKAVGLRPAFGDSYMQPFEIDLGEIAKEQSLEVVGPDGQAIEYPKVGEQFSALGISASAAFEGEAVFVGYGGVNKEHDYDSFRGAAADGLKGKVAVVFRYEPIDMNGRSLWTNRRGRWTETAYFINKAKWAAEHGALALLVVNPPRQALTGPLQSARFTSLASGQKAAGIPILHVRSWLIEQMVKKVGRSPDGTQRIDPLEGIVVRGKVELEHRSATIANVAAILPGVDGLADQVIIIGAHYDHLGYGEIASRSRSATVHPGADDNASGTAGMVMLARRFASRAYDGKPDIATKPRRTLVFVAFTGEERGLLGSSHFVKHLDEIGIKAEQIVAMINMDMIGRLRKDKLTLGGVGTGDRMEALIALANERVGLNLQLNGSGLGPSDHTVFYNARVPVLFAFTGMHTDYHTTTDTADKINAAGAVRVVDLLDHIAQDLWAELVHLAFTETKGYIAASPTQGLGQAFLGIMLDYAAGTETGCEEGCSVAAVTPGGPAAKAGLVAGDRIVKWNETAIPGVHALAAALRDSDLGQSGLLTVVRHNESIQLTVELGQR